MRQTVPAQGRRPFLSKRLRENLKGYLFILPWLIALLVFNAYPILASLFFALTDYNVLNPPTWAGLGNFQTMFSKDPLFWKAVWNTVYYSVLSVPLQLIFALALALLLNGRSWGIGIFRTIYYLPGLMPAVATALLWYVLLDPRLGLINSGLVALGLPRLGWMRSADWSKPALILIAIWSGSGVPMLIFLAGLRDIPKTLLEAATIDGATAWKRFWFVVLPLLSPTIFFNLLIGIINSFQVFTVAFIASEASASGNNIGPLNSMLMYMIHLYRNAFRYYQMGYASALALLMLIVLLLLALLLARSSSLWVYYEAGERA
ncbi:MAG: sugar ABC transporter permease [Chloroflexi bacterium]|nr:sugar ABC transporter permease [Chloroflexota bacterium]